MMLTLILLDSVHSEIFPRNIAKYNLFLFKKKHFQVNIPKK